MNDYVSLLRIIKETKPNEVYNLAAQSHVAVSFEMPEYTANSDALGVLRILEAIKNSGLKNKIKFYQASTSELYGNQNIKKNQNEDTPFNTASPYGVAKLYAYWITRNYRESYEMYASNGILFNHESPRRGETFVSKKITTAMVKIKFGKQKTLYLGNLDSKRDWGHAKDYVQMIWLMLQQKKPEDFVIATGKQYSVRDFVNLVAKKLKMTLKWSGKGINEFALYKNKKIIKIDPYYFRPSEVDNLLGDPSKAKKKFLVGGGWVGGNQKYGIAQVQI